MPPWAISKAGSAGQVWAQLPGSLLRSAALLSGLPTDSAHQMKPQRSISAVWARVCRRFGRSAGLPKPLWWMPPGFLARPSWVSSAVQKPALIPSRESQRPSECPPVGSLTGSGRWKHHHGGVLDRLRLPTKHGGLVARLSLLTIRGKWGYLALRSSLHLGSEVVPTPGESGHLRRLAFRGWPMPALPTDAPSMSRSPSA